MDASAAGLTKAQKLAAERGVALTTVEADLAEFGIEPGAWNAIVSIFAHVPPVVRLRLHRQATVGLVLGGAFVLEAYTPAQITLGTGGPSTPEITMPLSALRQELPGLNFDIAREIERDVYEGAFHHGRSAVVQLLAFRPS